LADNDIVKKRLVIKILINFIFFSPLKLKDIKFKY
jgi:hypothetical protein